MNILYIGDIMGEMGIEAVRRILPTVEKEYDVNIVVAQSENVTEGKGLSLKDYKKLQLMGVDFFTGGNWSMHRPEIHNYLNDNDRPIIRPANYPSNIPGKGYKYLQTPKGPILVISLLGHIVGRDADKPIENPLLTIDKILDETEHVKCVSKIVNFHGDFSSEKIVIGYYLDGRVTAVIGDHWHVPTADAMVLPKGTAHMTDVGMCGALHSSLGVKLDSIISRWRDGQINKNVLETDGPLQFNAALIKSNDSNGLADTISHIQKIFK